MRARHSRATLMRRTPLAFAAVAVALGGCSSSERLSQKVDPRYGVATSPRVVEFGRPVPKGGGVYRVGKPYMIAGREYVPEENVSYRADGMASWYGGAFHGRLTANGEIFDMQAITAAHPTLPMPSYVRVTSLANRRSIVVRVNDRGPFHSDRIIDLSTKAADLLGFRGNGVARVQVEYLGRAPIEGSDDRALMATLRQGDPAPHPAMVQVASSRGMVPSPPRGAIPLPESRPFALGDTQPDDAGSAGLVERDGRDGARDRAVTRAVYAPALYGNPNSPRNPGSVSAFAPSAPLARASLGDLSNGRGLY